MPARFHGLDRQIRRWLIHEQTVNERLLNLQVYRSIENRIPPQLRPETQPVWNQEVVWLPAPLVRRYGPIDAHLRAAFGIEITNKRTPLFLHPQPPAAHQRLRRKYGAAPWDGILATPTSSYRSVVTWDPGGDRSPVLLKLSIGAIIGKIRRAFREDQIARAVVISTLFDLIPIADRERLQFDWFPEPAGVAETQSGHGWLLRILPRSLQDQSANSVIPVFSLISVRPNRPPLLVDWIRRSKQKPEAFVIDRLLEPYVKTLSHLFFEHGLQCEGHSQNVLMEIGARDELTGRVIFRDLSDTTVNIAFRVAKGQPLPLFARGFLPKGIPFSVTANAYRNRYDRPVLLRGYDTVERFGNSAFVWQINASLSRFFKGYDSALVEQRYLELWQQAAIQYLSARPLFRKKPKGLAIDEAITWFLSQVDWRALGARPSHLPDDAEPLRIDRRMRPRNGRVYDRLESPWGDLFMFNGLPGFFRPAF